LALTYAAEQNVISENQASAMLAQAKQELLTLAAAQSEHVADELPAVKFIHAIKAMLARGDYYIEGATPNPPENAKWLGWCDQDFYYLQSEVTYNAVSDFLRREGEVIGLKQKALNAQLAHHKLIQPGEKGRLTAVCKHKGIGFVRAYAFYRNRFDEV